MNQKQRNKNRLTFLGLQSMKDVCPECGERGHHYIDNSSDGWFYRGSFWTCDKFYDKDGRRIQ